MDLSIAPQAGAWALFASLVFGAILIAAVFSAPWRLLLLPGQIHVYLGGCLALLLLWSLRAGVLGGLDFHLLGMTALTLMFGPQLAIVASAVALLGKFALGQLAWSALGSSGLVAGVLPVLVTYILLRRVQARLPAHLFVYVFLNAFLAGGLGALACALAATGIIWGSGTQPFSVLEYQFLPYLPMLAFSEAVLNGMLIMGLIAFQPQWLQSFDDERYLGRGP